MGEIDYVVWWPDNGECRDDGIVMRAPCAADAAKDWAEHKASRDAEYVSGFIDDGADVFVSKAGSEDVVRIHVRGNPDVYYTAHVQP